MSEYILPTIKLVFFSDKKTIISISLKDLFLNGLYGKDFYILKGRNKLNLNEEVILERILFGTEVFSIDIEPFQGIILLFTPKLNKRLLENFLTNKEIYNFESEDLESKFNSIKNNYKNSGFIFEFETTSILPIYLFILDKFYKAIKVEEVEQ